MRLNPMMQGEFRRGQVELALWQFFAGAGLGIKPPKVFRARITRLLELDRKKAIEEVGEDLGVRYAFHNYDPPGSGSDMGYSAFNAFCIAVGLELLDLGFKQSEVVRLMRYARADFEEAFAYALGFKLPLDRDEDRQADWRYFAVINRVEMSEIYAGYKAGRDVPAPVVSFPEFYRGIEELRKVIGQIVHDHRKVIVVELTQTAVNLIHHLEETPATKRGRK